MSLDAPLTNSPPNMTRMLKFPCLKLLFAVAFAISLLVSYTILGQQQMYSRCYTREKHMRARSFPRAFIADVLKSPVLPRPGRSIFFHETSCRHPHAAEALQQLELNARQACAIESAAKYNRKSSVFVLFAMPTYINGSIASPLIDALESYTNVFLRSLNIWTYAEDTPMQAWLDTGELFQSSYLLSHISDFLRYLTLWRWGGTYLDMDTVTLRSMEDMPPNYTGAESDENLAAGVMNFAHDGFGHQIADACLRDLQMNFNGDEWGNNGPGVITRVMHEVCGTTNIHTMQQPHRCKQFRVYPREAFYAIPWRQWSHFFTPEHLNSTLSRTRDSYVVHVWNKHSASSRIKVGSQVAYAKIAERHCPKVYAAAGEYF